MKTKQKTNARNIFLQECGRNNYKVFKCVRKTNKGKITPLKMSHILAVGTVK